MRAKKLSALKDLEERALYFYRTIAVGAPASQNPNLISSAWLAAVIEALEQTNLKIVPFDETDRALRIVDETKPGTNIIRFKK